MHFAMNSLKLQTLISFQSLESMLNKKLTVGISVTTFRNASSFQIKEQTTIIDKYKINYTEVGTGKHPVLLLPGAMGTIQSDFAPQLECLDREKFTLVCWDPIGYGKSRPPEREYIKDFYVNDAQVVAKLMKKLGKEMYSVVGWSDGAITGIILAALHPGCVHRLVLLSSMAYITQEDVQIYQGLKDISKWTPQLREKLEAVYGAEYLRRLWTEYHQYFETLLKEGNGDVCLKYLTGVRCPTLVMHGCLDPVTPLHHGQYVADNIQGAKLHLFEKGKHNFHYKFAAEVNERIEEFLSIKDTS